MPKILIGILGVLIIGGGLYFVLKGSGSGDLGSASSAAVAEVNETTSADSAASTTSQQAPASSTATTTNPKNKMQATLHTSKGDITVAFYEDQAPQTTANFIKLAQSGFYDKTKFHRVIKGFMDQAGDPLTKDNTQQAKWGTGGPGYTIPDEISSTLTNTAGTLAMANTGAPHTGGSQFFINAVDNPALNGGYTVFGHVTSGMDVVTAINNTPTDSSDRPLSPVIIESVSVK